MAASKKKDIEVTISFVKKVGSYHVPEIIKDIQRLREEMGKFSHFFNNTFSFKVSKASFDTAMKYFNELNVAIDVVKLNMASIGGGKNTFAGMSAEAKLAVDQINQITAALSKVTIGNLGKEYANLGKAVEKYSKAIQDTISPLKDFETAIGSLDVKIKASINDLATYTALIQALKTASQNVLNGARAGTQGNTGNVKFTDQEKAAISTANRYQSLVGKIDEAAHHINQFDLNAPLKKGFDSKLIVNDINNVQMAYRKLAFVVDQLKKNATTLPAIGANPAAIAKNSAALSDYQNRLNSLTQVVDKTERISSKLKLHEKFTEMNNGLSETLARQAQFAASAFVLYGSVQQVYTGFKSLYDIITETQRVMVVSRSDFLTTADTAKLLANTISEATTKNSKSIQENARVLKEFGSAGLTTEQSIAALDSTMANIVSTDSDVTETTRLVASIFNTLGNTVAHTNNQVETFTRINDILARGTNESSLEMDQLVQALKFSLPAAKESGMSLEYLTAVLAQLADQGLRGGNAGRALRSVFQQISTDIPKFAKAFGVDIPLDKPLDMMHIMEQVGAKIKDQQISADRLGSIFSNMGLRGADVFLLWAQGIDKVNAKYKDLMENSQGIAKIGEKMRLEGAEATFAKFQANVSAFVRGSLGGLAELFISLVRGINNMSDNLKLLNNGIILGLSSLAKWSLVVVGTFGVLKYVVFGLWEGLFSLAVNAGKAEAAFNALAVATTNWAKASAAASIIGQGLLAFLSSWYGILAAILIVVGLVMLAVYAFADSYEFLNKKMQDELTTLREQTLEHDKLAKSYDNVIKKIQDAKYALDRGNTTQTEFNALMNDMIQNNPQLADSIASYGNNVEALVANLKVLRDVQIMIRDMNKIEENKKKEDAYANDIKQLKLLADSLDLIAKRNKNPNMNFSLMSGNNAEIAGKAMGGKNKVMIEYLTLRSELQKLAMELPQLRSIVETEIAKLDQQAGVNLGAGNNFKQLGDIIQTSNDIARKFDLSNMRNEIKGLESAAIEAKSGMQGFRDKLLMEMNVDISKDYVDDYNDKIKKLQSDQAAANLGPIYGAAGEMAGSAFSKRFIDETNSSGLAEVLQKKLSGAGVSLDGGVIKTTLDSISAIIDQMEVDGTVYNLKLQESILLLAGINDQYNNLTLEAIKSGKNEQAINDIQKDRVIALNQITAVYADQGKYQLMLYNASVRSQEIEANRAVMAQIFDSSMDKRSRISVSQLQQDQEAVDLAKQQLDRFLEISKVRERFVGAGAIDDTTESGKRLIADYNHSLDLQQKLASATKTQWDNLDKTNRELFTQQNHWEHISAKGSERLNQLKEAKAQLEYERKHYDDLVIQLAARNSSDEVTHGIQLEVEESKSKQLKLESEQLQNARQISAYNDAMNRSFIEQSINHKAVISSGNEQLANLKAQAELNTFNIRNQNTYIESISREGYALSSSVKNNKERIEATTELNKLEDERLKIAYSVTEAEDRILTGYHDQKIISDFIRKGGDNQIDQLGAQEMILEQQLKTLGTMTGYDGESKKQHLDILEIKRKRLEIEDALLKIHREQANAGLSDIDNILSARNALIAELAPQKELVKAKFQYEESGVRILHYQAQLAALQGSEISKLQGQRTLTVAIAQERLKQLEALKIALEFHTKIYEMQIKELETQSEINDMRKELVQTAISRMESPLKDIVGGMFSKNDFGQTFKLIGTMGLSVGTAVSLLGDGTKKTEMFMRALRAGKVDLSNYSKEIQFYGKSFTLANSEMEKMINLQNQMNASKFDMALKEIYFQIEQGSSESKSRAFELLSQLKSSYKVIEANRDSPFFNDTDLPKTLINIDKMQIALKNIEGMRTDKQASAFGQMSQDAINAEDSIAALNRQLMLTVMFLKQLGDQNADLGLNTPEYRKMFDEVGKQSNVNGVQIPPELSSKSFADLIIESVKAAQEGSKVVSTSTISVGLLQDSKNIQADTRGYIGTLVKLTEEYVKFVTGNNYNTKVSNKITGYATGGVIGGTGTGDIIPAMLEPGEFVIPKDIVKRYGSGYFFKMIRNQERHFATGGVGGMSRIAADAAYSGEISTRPTREMVKEAVNIEQIARYTELTAEELQKLSDKVMDYTARKFESDKNIKNGYASFSTGKGSVNHPYAANYGFVQFNQDSYISTLMRMMEKANSSKYFEIFGETLGKQLMQDKYVDTRYPTADKHLEKYKDKFARAADVPEFQNVQRELAKKEFFDKIVPVAQAHKLTSEKALIMFFDAAIQGGTGDIIPLMRRQLSGDGTDDEKLRRFAMAADAMIQKNLTIAAQGRRMQIYNDSTLSTASNSANIEAVMAKDPDITQKMLSAQISEMQKKANQNYMNNNIISEISDPLIEVIDLLDKVDHKIVDIIELVANPLATVWKGYKDRIAEVAAQTDNMFTKAAYNAAGRLIDRVENIGSVFEDVFTVQIPSFLQFFLEKMLLSNARILADVEMQRQKTIKSYNDQRSSLIEQLKRNEISYYDFFDKMEDLKKNQAASEIDTEEEKNRLLVENMKSAFQEMADVMNKIINDMTNGFSDLLNGIPALVDVANSALGSLGEGFSQSIAGIFNSIFSLTGSKSASGLSGVVGGGAGAGIGGLIGGIAGIGGGIPGVLGGAAAGAGTGAGWGSTIGNVIGNIADTLMSSFGVLLAPLKMIAQAAITIMTNMFSMAVQGFSQLLNIVIEIGTMSKNEFYGFTQTIADLPQMISDTANGIAERMPLIVDALVNGMIPVFHDVVDQYGNITKELTYENGKVLTTSSGGSIITKVATAFANAIEKVFPQIMNAFSQILINAIMSASTVLVSFFAQIPGYYAAIISTSLSIVPAVIIAFKRVAIEFGTFLRNEIPAIAENFSNAIITIIDSFSSVFSDQEFFGAIAEGVPKIADAIAGALTNNTSKFSNAIDKFAVVFSSSMIKLAPSLTRAFIVIFSSSLNAVIPVILESIIISMAMFAIAAKDVMVKAFTSDMIPQIVNQFKDAFTNMFNSLKNGQSGLGMFGGLERALSGFYPIMAITTGAAVDFTGVLGNMYMAFVSIQSAVVSVQGSIIVAFWSIVSMYQSALSSLWGTAFTTTNTLIAMGAGIQAIIVEIGAAFGLISEIYSYVMVSLAAAIMSFWSAVVILYGVISALVAEVGVWWIVLIAAGVAITYLIGVFVTTFIPTMITIISTVVMIISAFVVLITTILTVATVISSFIVTMRVFSDISRVIQELTFSVFKEFYNAVVNSADKMRELTAEFSELFAAFIRLTSLIIGGVAVLITLGSQMAGLFEDSYFLTEGLKQARATAKEYYDVFKKLVDEVFVAAIADTKKLTDELNKMGESLNDNKGSLETMNNLMKGFTSVVNQVNQFMKPLVNFLMPGFRALLEFIALTIAGPIIVALVAFIAILYVVQFVLDSVAIVGEGLNAVFQILAPIIKQIADQFSWLTPVIQTLLPIIGVLTALFITIGIVFLLMIGPLGPLIALIAVLTVTILIISAAIQAMKFVFEQLQGPIDYLGNVLRTIIEIVNNSASGFNDLGTTIQNFKDLVVNLFSTMVDQILDQLRKLPGGNAAVDAYNEIHSKVAELTSATTYPVAGGYAGVRNGSSPMAGVNPRGSIYDPMNAFRGARAAGGGRYGADTREAVSGVLPSGPINVPQREFVAAQAATNANTIDYYLKNYYTNETADRYGKSPTYNESNTNRNYGNIATNDYAEPVSSIKMEVKVDMSGSNFTSEHAADEVEKVIVERLANNNGPLAKHMRELTKKR